LVNWTIVNHALDRVPGERYDQVRHGCGVWAPSIRHHAGRFWIFFPTPDEGIFVTTADDPRGRWSEPRMVHAGRGLIDPCPLWDDDGNAYLVFAYAHSRCGLKDQLRVCPMAPDGSRLLSEGQIVFHDERRHPTLEGPKFYKRDGWYYILAPAGGVATGWQVAMRSRSVYGPYEAKVVLEQGSTGVNGPHQGALLDTANGRQWWFVHFQERQPYGRVVHLQPVTWRDGWPLMGVDGDGNGVGEPVEEYEKPATRGDEIAAIAVPATSDDFDSPRLGLQWQWHANYRDEWFSLVARPGWLRLVAQPTPESQNLADFPALLMQKPPAPRFAVETCVELKPGATAGIAVVGSSYAALAVERAAGAAQQRIVLQMDGKEVAHAEGIGGAPVTLRVRMTDGGTCMFAYMDGGVERTIGPAFAAREGKWIGAKVGLFCAADSNSTATNAHADFDYFRFGG
jgi:beta-xylosidase